MEFSQIPANYSPIGQPIRYAFRHPEAGTFDFRIEDSTTQTTLGIKRFVSTAAGSFDIAPYVRSAIRYNPVPGTTGFIEAPERSVTVTVTVAGTASPPRTCLYRLRTAQEGILTSLPRTRLIAPGERDEITLLAMQPCTATVTARNSGSAECETFRTAGQGLFVFRLDTTEFPDAEEITLSFGEIGEIEYIVVPGPEHSRRLAWVSTEGSVEHYTFPIHRTTQVRCKDNCSRERLAPGNTRTETHMTLLSAYETPQVLGALAEILASPAVWIAGKEEYTPVDVLTTEACTLGPESMRPLEITIRTTCKTPTR